MLNGYGIAYTYFVQMYWCTVLCKIYRIDFVKDSLNVYPIYPQSQQLGWGTAKCSLFWLTTTTALLPPPPPPRKCYSRLTSTKHQQTESLLFLIYSDLLLFTLRKFFILFTTVVKRITKKMFFDINKLHFDKMWILFFFISEILVSLVRMEWG